MKLGEMLVRDGRLTEQQLQGVLAQQGRDGARLGTVLIELGMIDLDVLTVYLGLELGIPIATGAMLERAKRSAVRLLLPAQAARHRCVPLMVQDRQLIAAVDDPLDFDNLDALSEITGYRIIPRVAPEIRIHYYVERFYGAPRPARFNRFGETPRGDQTPIAGLPAAPLPGLPPVPSKPIAAPGPSPELRRVASVSGFDNSEALELDADDLIVALESDDAAAAEATPIDDNAARMRRTREQRAVTPVVDLEPMSPAEALQVIETATDRGHIADALMRFAVGMFDVSALFVVRDNFAIGWKAGGNNPGRAHIDHVLIPLDGQSLLGAAVADEDGFFEGPVTSSTLHSYFYKVLGCAPPARAAAAMVAIGRRVVNILYGHRSERPALTEAELAEVRKICRAAAESYARLIATSKQQRDSMR